MNMYVLLISLITLTLTTMTIISKDISFVNGLSDNKLDIMDEDILTILQNNVKLIENSSSVVSLFNGYQDLCTGGFKNIATDEQFLLACGHIIGNLTKHLEIAFDEIDKGNDIWVIGDKISSQLK